MEEYQEYLKKEIMYESRHLFIYGRDNDYRTKFLQSLEEDYPLLLDSDKPIALYIDSLGFPVIEEKTKDKSIINSMSREYLNFTIAAKILEKTLEIDENITSQRLTKIIDTINLFKNKDYKEIQTVKELLKEFNNTREFYLNNYIDYANGLVSKIPINDISIPFLQIEMFVSEYKRTMNISSYFGLIFEKNNPIAISSTKAINSLIGSRINKYMSIKVATDPSNWNTYYDLSGQLVEAIHDYGKIELDNSYKEYTKTLIKKCNIKE